MLLVLAQSTVPTQKKGLCIGPCEDISPSVDPPQTMQHSAAEPNTRFRWSLFHAVVMFAECGGEGGKAVLSLTVSLSDPGKSQAPTTWKPKQLPLCALWARVDLTTNFAVSSPKRATATSAAVLTATYTTDAPHHTSYMDPCVFCLQVQDAILHNKRIFEQRMLLEDKGLMRKVLQGWRLKACASAVKEARLRKAVARLTRSTMARAFYAWRDAYHLVDKTLAMKRKVGGEHVASMVCVLVSLGLQLDFAEALLSSCHSMLSTWSTRNYP